ncbi:uncharacterized protein LOC117341357 [Pecten maximus]|uniref:uncharacterized protein LOC117341357 n=1 Tax=Pecten maximus TaxID=6579 RepID=UPI0014588772|nr:uncharacterized protein LOC117341357 [Pecten maximus]
MSMALHKMVTPMLQGLRTIPSGRTVNCMQRRIHVSDNVKFKIRPMRTQDLPTIFQLLNAEKWIMEKAYLDCAFSTDPRGFVLAETTDQQIIGFHGSLSLTDNLDTLGLWYVKNGYRCSGVGAALVERTIKCPQRNFGTFTWPYLQESIDSLMKSKTTQTYTTWYNYGQIEQRVERKSKYTEKHLMILPLHHSMLSDVVQYDTKVHKIPRESYITNWITHDNSKTYVAVKNDTVCGYAVLRTQDAYTTIAPLYADDEYIADELFLQLASKVSEGRFVNYTSPLENNAGTRLAVRNGLMKRGMPMLMVFRQEPIYIDINRVFAVSSTSFGLC